MIPKDISFMRRQSRLSIVIGSKNTNSSKGAVHTNLSGMVIKSSVPGITSKRPLPNYNNQAANSGSPLARMLRVRAKFCINGYKALDLIHALTIWLRVL